MPHDKLGRNVCVGDSVRFRRFAPLGTIIGTVYALVPGTDTCNLRAIAAEVLPLESVAERGVAYILPSLMAPRGVASLLESGWLTASEVELVARADGKPVTEPDESQLRVFAGFLSAHMPELLDVEVPRLKAAVDDFLAASVAPAAEPA